jgi:predicted dehydrogenase
LPSLSVRRVAVPFTRMEPLRIGIVGIGNISGIYLTNLSNFRSTTVVAVADLDRNRAAAAAEEHKVPLVLSPDELISHPDVEMVLNLTVPAAHGPVALQAIHANKHVYNEKPICTTMAEADELLREATSRSVRIGCAPDTFLGAGIQTARALIDKGDIGTPVAAQAFMLSRGPEGWHPNPEFFFKPGGGPMLDMGPYYLTALVNLLGPVHRTTGVARASFPSRTVGSGPLKGSQIPVETPTHVAGVIEFEGGAVGEITTSFDVYFGHLHPITIYGSEGTVKVPDPNGFGGEVLLRRNGDSDWQSVPLRPEFSENSRGLGLLDMAYKIRNGGEHRANGKLAAHVLETMLSFEKSSQEGRHQLINSKIERPEAVAEQEYEGEQAVKA